MRRVLTGIIAIALAVGAALMTGASGEQSGTGKTYKIQFDNAFGLTQGGDFKVGGVRAGQTSGFDLKKIGDGRYVAEVEAQITEPGVGGLRKDATCEIRPQSLIGEYFVDCQSGSGEPLADGGTLPVKQTASTVPPDLMQNVMRRPYRERFRLILAELGTGLAGRPQDLQEVLKRASPGLRETSKVLQILGRQNEIIKDFIVNSDTVVRDLEAKKRDVARWVRSAGRTAEISATRQAGLRDQWRQFPGFLRELEPTMAQLSELADEQTPLLRETRAAVPQLQRFFEDLGPFTEASRPSIRSLAATARVGNRAMKEADEEITELRGAARNAPSAARNLRQFLQSMDDRRRAFEPDARAKAVAPPAPDPTAYKDGDGFTGFEHILNYFYWQTLALNPYDQLGHLLRVLLIEESPCAEWQTGPVTEENKDLFEKCNSWLGPHQPNVTAPDPTDNEYAAASSGATSTKRGADRPVKGGDPEAEKPLPGQRDVSEPRPVLPPAVRDLLEKLKLPQLPLDAPKLDLPLNQQTTSPADERSADKLLDFLLAP